MNIKHTISFMAGLSAVILPVGVLAYTEVVEEPGFEVRLQAEPIVVHAGSPELLRKSQRRFEPVGGELDDTEAYTETYLHYQFSAVEIMKGKVERTFEVRAIAERSPWVEQLDPDGQYLLVMAPDPIHDGDNEQPRPYLISYQTAWPVQDGKIAVPEDAGDGTWTLERVRETIEAHAEAHRQHLARSPEPTDASGYPPVAGELEPQETPPLPEVPRTRDDEPRSEARLADLEPGRVQSPAASISDGDDDEAEAIGIWIWLTLALLAIILLLVLIRVSKSKV